MRHVHRHTMKDTHTHIQTHTHTHCGNPVLGGSGSRNESNRVQGLKPFAAFIATDYSGTHGTQSFHPIGSP